MTLHPIAMSDNRPSNKTLAKAIAVFGGAQAFSVFAALIRTKVAAHYIGAAGVGLNAFYVTLSNLIAVLMGFGLANSSVPSLSQAQGEEQLQAVGRLRLLGCVLALASVPVTLLVTCFYSAQALWLALPVALTILSGIEMAVMKSLRATRQLSLSLMMSALFSVLFSVPFYVLMGFDGVIWALTSTMSMSSLFTCIMGYRVCRRSPDFALWGKALWPQVRPMFVLGLAFLISGLFAQGVDLVNQLWLQSVATLAVVGLYKAGFQLAVVYTEMIFTAIANDFYPRLASVAQDVVGRNRLITQQVRVLLLIVTPLILLFVVLVPWLVPLLFSDEFMPIVPMVRVAALSVIVKAVYLPIGYLPVVLGRTWHFLWLEILSWSILAVGVIAGYLSAGLTGVGYGILLSNVLDLLVIGLFCRYRYHFRFQPPAS